jgi:hypothetical protein
MYQQIGIGITVVAVLILLYWIWDKWLKTSSTTTTTTTPATTVSTSTSVFDTTQLTKNLSYIELLSKVSEIAASPDAVKACDIIADTLWQGAITTWKAAQTTTTQATEIVVKTVKVTTVDGSTVEVPVQ